MYYLRVLGFAAAGFSAGLATSILVIYTCNKVSQPQGVGGLVVVGVFLLVMLPATGTI